MVLEDKNVPKQSNVARTADIAPVRLENGRLVVRQCRAKLHYEQSTSRNIVEFNRKTVGDILCKLKYNQQIYKNVRGDK